DLGSSPACSRAAPTATAPSSGAVTLWRPPRKVPMGVRAALTMTTSFMLHLAWVGRGVFRSPPRGIGRGGFRCPPRGIGRGGFRSPPRGIGVPLGPRARILPALDPLRKTAPAFLAVGHVTTDVIGGLAVSGGSALYA